MYTVKEKTMFIAICILTFLLFIQVLKHIVANRGIDAGAIFFYCVVMALQVIIGVIVFSCVQIFSLINAMLFAIAYIVYLLVFWEIHKS